MQTICALSRYRFASGAEEKIVRIFQAPANFVQNFQRICNVNDDPEGDAILKSKIFLLKLLTQYELIIIKLPKKQQQIFSCTKRSICAIIGSFK